MKKKPTSFELIAALEKRVTSLEKPIEQPFVLTDEERVTFIRLIADHAPQPPEPPVRWPRWVTVMALSLAIILVPKLIRDFAPDGKMVAVDQCPVGFAREYDGNVYVCVSPVHTEGMKAVPLPHDANGNANAADSPPVAVSKDGQIAIAYDGTVVPLTSGVDPYSKKPPRITDSTKHVEYSSITGCAGIPNTATNYVDPVWRLDVEAIEKCWVSVRTPKATMFEGTLQAGDIKHTDDVPQDIRVTVRSGCPGSMRYWVNGEEVQPEESKVPHDMSKVELIEVHP
jgi:Domain of unknown function (DUF4115)